MCVGSCQKGGELRHKIILIAIATTAILNIKVIILVEARRTITISLFCCVLFVDN